MYPKRDKLFGTKTVLLLKSPLYVHAECHSKNRVRRSKGLPKYWMMHFDETDILTPLLLPS